MFFKFYKANTKKIVKPYCLKLLSCALLAESTRVDIVDEKDDMSHINPEEQERLLNRTQSYCLELIAKNLNSSLLKLKIFF